VIDLHTHVLPGVDDGVRSLADAVELARLAEAEGITAIAATPHVRADYPTTAERMERGVAELRLALGEHGVEVELLHGGEIDLERLPTLPDPELRRFTLAQTGRYLLLEFPYYGWPVGLDATVFGLLARGLTPVIAHPERNSEVEERPERLAPLVDAGALVQVTAASLEGRLGREPRTCARELLARGLVHVLASDAHAPEIRAAGLAAAADAVGDRGLARYLTTDVPAAIVAGADPPARPHARRRRRFLVF
jgi:protein-tyrosine phosphatase